MEKFYDASIKINTGFGIGSRQPLDARTVCETITQMNEIPDTRRYEGLVVYVEENKRYYKYNVTEFEALSVEQVIDNLSSNSTNVGLSANQGRVLKELIDSLSDTSTNLGSLINDLQTQITNNDNEYTLKFDSITQSLNDINNKIVELQNKDISIDEKISSLQQIDKELQDSLKTLSDTLNNKNAEQDAEIESLKEKDTELEKSIESLRDDVNTGAAASGKVKITDTGQLGYLKDKIIKGKADHNNGKFAVDLTEENDTLKISVEVPIPVWQKL